MSLVDKGEAGKIQGCNNEKGSMKMQLKIECGVLVTIAVANRKLPERRPWHHISFWRSAAGKPTSFITS